MPLHLDGTTSQMPGTAVLKCCGEQIQLCIKFSQYPNMQPDSRCPEELLKQKLIIYSSEMLCLFEGVGRIHETCIREQECCKTPGVSKRWNQQVYIFFLFCYLLLFSSQIVAIMWSWHCRCAAQASVLSRHYGITWTEYFNWNNQKLLTIL